VHFVGLYYTIILQSTVQKYIKFTPYIYQILHHQQIR